MEDDNTPAKTAETPLLVAKTEPDELAVFFDVGESEATKPEQILADVQEAKRDGFSRRSEVNKAVADPENPTTSKAENLEARSSKGW